MNNEEKIKAKKILNKTVNGQIYLINKYGMRLGWLAYNYLYIEANTKNTKKRIQALNGIIDATNEEYKQIEEIIACELKLAN